MKHLARGLLFGLLLTVRAAAQDSPPPMPEVVQPELPASVTALLAESVTGMNVMEWIADEDADEIEYRIYGELDGSEVEVEVDTTTNHVPTEIEIKYVSSRARTLRNGIDIPVAAVPATITDAVVQRLGAVALLSARSGTYAEEEGYELTGLVGRDELEVKVTASGRLLKIERSFEPAEEPDPGAAPALQEPAP